MNEKQRCDGCRFSVSNDGPVMPLTCRRFPPEVTSVVGSPVAHHPTVKDGDWCGEYQPKHSPKRRFRWKREKS